MAIYRSVEDRLQCWIRKLTYIQRNLHQQTGNWARNLVSPIVIIVNKIIRQNAVSIQKKSKIAFSINVHSQYGDHCALAIIIIIIRMLYVICIDQWTSSCCWVAMTCAEKIEIPPISSKIKVNTIRLIDVRERVTCSINVTIVQLLIWSSLICALNDRSSHVVSPAPAEM